MAVAPADPKDDEAARWEAGVELFAGWQENPRQAAYDLFADPETASGRLELQDHQADVIARVFAGHDVTWRSSHGVGKTTTLAILVHLYLLFRPYSKVPTTAPTWHQVRNVLWSEIAKWHERFRFKAFFELDKTKLAVKRSPSTWFAIGVASNRATNIEGFHSRRLLVVADEAKGIADGMYDAFDGACTEGGQRIYASTPGSRVGKFYQSHHGRIAELFSVVHTDGEKAPRVSKKWVALKRLEWGEDSPIYIAKVRGEFPQEGDDILYPLDWLDAAEAAFLELVEPNGPDVFNGGIPAVGHGRHYAIGCDVARFGFNKTVAIGGSLRRLDRLSSWARKPTTETTANLFAIIRECEEAGYPVGMVSIDDTGLGGGVTDQLREKGRSVDAVLFGGAPDDKEQFGNKKAELAYALRKALDENRQARARGEAGSFAMLPHDRLKGQLSALRRRYGGKGVLSIVDPDDPSVPASELAPGMKVSPDHAHAAILAYHGATAATAAGVGEVKRQPDDETRHRQMRRMSSYIFRGRGPGR